MAGAVVLSHILLLTLAAGAEIIGHRGGNFTGVFTAHLTDVVVLVNESWPSFHAYSSISSGSASPVGVCEATWDINVFDCNQEAIYSFGNAQGPQEFISINNCPLPSARSGNVTLRPARACEYRENCDCPYTITIEPVPTLTKAFRQAGPVSITSRGRWLAAAGQLQAQAQPWTATAKNVGPSACCVRIWTWNQYLGDGPVFPCTDLAPGDALTSTAPVDGDPDGLRFSETASWAVERPHCPSNAPEGSCGPCQLELSAARLPIKVLPANGSATLSVAAPGEALYYQLPGADAEASPDGAVALVTVAAPMGAAQGACRFNWSLVADGERPEPAAAAAGPAPFSGPGGARDFRGAWMGAVPVPSGSPARLELSGLSLGCDGGEVWVAQGPVHTAPFGATVAVPSMTAPASASLRTPPRRLGGGSADGLVNLTARLPATASGSCVVSLASTAADGLPQLAFVSELRPGETASAIVLGTDEDTAAVAVTALSGAGRPPCPLHVTMATPRTDVLVINATSSPVTVAPGRGLALRYNGSTPVGPHSWSVHRLTVTLAPVRGECNVSLASAGFAGPSGPTHTAITGRLKPGHDPVALVIYGEFLNAFGRSIAVQRTDSGPSAADCAFSITPTVRWGPPAALLS